MTTIGFLHTAQTHVATFETLLAELGPQHNAVHLVDPELLAAAGRDGITAAVTAALTSRMQELNTAGAELIVCTCSTLGACAELIDETVLRGDLPMADAAVLAGTRIAVVATVASTLQPTTTLLAQSAARAGVQVTLIEAACLPAWDFFAAGDLAGYAQHIATYVREIAASAEVIVFAQASMTPAADLLTDLPNTVLTSPRAAVIEAVRRAG